jgi:hypothetical protein
MLPTRSKLIAFTLAVLAVAAFVSSADAGWVTIKNETKQAIVVQEVAIVNGKTVRGKPVKLAAGESFREFQNTPGIKNYEIYDAATSTVVWRDSLNCKADSQSFAVGVANGRVGVVPVAEPKR